MLATIGAVELHHSGVDGNGVGIAIIDTGVSPVPALQGRVRPGVELCGSGSTADGFGHGTAVAGLAAGGALGPRTVGVAPRAHVVPVRVAGRTGATDVSSLIAAVRWTVSHREELALGVLVISAGTDSATPADRDPLRSALARAWGAGIVVVASVGNRGPARGTALATADAPWVISVGASRVPAAPPRGRARPVGAALAAFTGRGDGRAVTAGVPAPVPALLAPGVEVESLRVPGSFVEVSNPATVVDRHQVRGSGSGLAAGVAAGCAALVLHAHPDWSPDRVRAALLGSASGVTGTGPGGVVHVGRAVDWRGRVEPASLPVPSSAPLGAARGTLAVRLPEGRILDATSDDTAQGHPFDPESLQEEWTAATWERSTFAREPWAPVEWADHRWRPAHWYAVDW